MRNHTKKFVDLCLMNLASPRYSFLLNLERIGTLHENQVGWLNLDVARRLGLDLDGEVLSYFERRITGGTSEMCM